MARRKANPFKRAAPVWNPVKLRNAVEAQPYNVDTLALMAGVSRATLYAWMKGETEPGATHLAAVCSVLSVDMNSLFDGPEGG